MKSLIFILLIGVSAADNDKLVGEYECEPHSQPHYVSLSQNNGFHFCDGSLVNVNWVVSAAHCYNRHSRILVHLGDHHIGVNENTEQSIPSSRVIIHPRFSLQTFEYDIMLIKLSRPATLNQNVQPVALPTSCAPVYTMCTVSGRANIINSTADRNKLQCLDIHILSDRECKTCYPFTNTDTVLCAGYLGGGKESCLGDSGGPVVCKGELQGIVSVGNRCVENCPRLYTKVCIFVDWLNNMMATN